MDFGVFGEDLLLESRMLRSCLNPTNSCTCCANGLSLVTAQRITPTRITAGIQRSMRRLRRGRGIVAGASTSTTTAFFGGELTGLPHFRQNSASSGSVAPHLLHPNRTLVGGGVVLSVGIRTGPRRHREARAIGDMSANSSTGLCGLRATP